MNSSLKFIPVYSQQDVHTKTEMLPYTTVKRRLIKCYFKVDNFAQKYILHYMSAIL